MGAQEEPDTKSNLEACMQSCSRNYSWCGVGDKVCLKAHTQREGVKSQLELEPGTLNSNGNCANRLLVKSAGQGSRLSFRSHYKALRFQAPAVSSCVPLSGLRLQGVAKVSWVGWISIPLLGLQWEVRFDHVFLSPEWPQKSVGAAQSPRTGTWGVKQMGTDSFHGEGPYLALVLPPKRTHLVGSQHQGMAAALRQGSVSTNHFCYFLH